MIEIEGDLWQAHALGDWIAITTNPVINTLGELVMGRGVALQAAQRFPTLPKVLAQHIKTNGNHVAAFPAYKIIAFPVKHHWRHAASPLLIERSAQELVKLDGLVRRPIYMVRPGCGNGKLEWEAVKKIIGPILVGDDYIVVEKAEKAGGK